MIRIPKLTMPCESLALTAELDKRSRKRIGTAWLFPQHELDPVLADLAFVKIGQHGSG